KDALNLLGTPEELRDAAEFDKRLFPVAWKMPVNGLLMTHAVIVLWTSMTWLFLRLPGRGLFQVVHNVRLLEAIVTGGFCASILGIVFNLHFFLRLYSLGDALHLIALSSRWLSSEQRH